MELTRQLVNLTRGSLVYDKQIGIAKVDRFDGGIIRIKGISVNNVMNYTEKFFEHYVTNTLYLPTNEIAVMKQYDTGMVYATILTRGGVVGIRFEELNPRFLTPRNQNLEIIRGLMQWF